MAIPSAECFPGLDLRDQLTAIYEALLELSSAEDPTSAECFRGEDQLDQITDLYEVILGITGSGSEDLPTPDCIKWLDRYQQLGYIYEALFNIAGDDDLLSPDCFEAYDLRHQLSYIYDAFRVISGDEDLPTRECFLAGDWDQMLAGIFDALIDAGPPVSTSIPVDQVVDFSSGSGLLSSADLDASTHGENWGAWSEPVLPTSHTFIETHDARMPIPFLCDGVLYEGASPSQGITFDFATEPLGADTFHLAVNFALNISDCQLFFLVKYADVLDVGSPNSYHNDLYAISGADFTVPQRQHLVGGAKNITAHSNGDLGASVTDNGGWLLISVFHDVANQHGRLIVHQVVDATWVLGALLGTSTSNQAVPSGVVNNIRMQDYLRPPNGTGDIKVKMFALRRSVLSWPPFTFTIPPPTSVVANQSAPNEVTLSWVSVCDIFKIERKIGAGAYATLEAEFENNGTDSYTDPGLTEGLTYTYRVSVVIGTSNSSAVESNAATIDNELVPAAGNVLWLKADSLSLADNDPVTTWTDSSGLGNDVTQATAANKPTYKTNIVNGKPVVRGDGGDFMIHTGVVTGNEIHTMAIVLKRSATAGVIPFYNGNAAGNGWGFYMDGSNNRAALFGGAAAKVDGATSATDFEIWIHTWNGTLSHLWVNGVDEIITDVFTAPGGAPSGNTEVMGLSTGNQWNGDVAEILVWDNVLSDLNRQETFNFLGFKYGITITP